MDDYTELRTDQIFRSRVKLHMTRQEKILRKPASGDCFAGNGHEEDPAPLHATLVAVVREDEYVMGGMQLIYEANKGVTRTEAGWREYFDRLGIDPMTRPPVGAGVCDAVGLEEIHGPSRISGRPASMVPRFVAGVVHVLRSRLVSRKRTEDNILVVTREYHKICKIHGVHRGDIVLHQQAVLNCYFTEDVDVRSATARTRAPKWAKWVLGITDSPTEPTVC